MGAAPDLVPIVGELASRCQFRETRMLATIPSGFLDEIYAAQSLR